MINIVMHPKLNKVYTLVIGLLLSLAGYSQSCLPDGITFYTQGQIDSFNIVHPNCTVIEGNVTIYTDEETNINNLNGLILVTSIGGSLRIKQIYPWVTVTLPNGKTQSIPYAEIYSTHMENQIRSENNLPLRVSYGINAAGGADPSTRIIRAGTSQSIYYNQNGVTNYSPLKRKQTPFTY